MPNRNLHELPQNRLPLNQAALHWLKEAKTPALPIPRFDPTDKLHKALAEVGAEAEKIAANVEFPDGMHFQTARRRVREALAEAGVSQRIDGLVGNLLG
jgi:hypothetical protein